MASNPDAPVTRASGSRARRTNIVTIRLTDSALSWIDGLAEKEDRTRADMLRVLIQEAHTARTRR